MPPVDINAHLHDLRVQMDRLKVLYEQYFLGIEKLAPTVPRREVEKLLDFLGNQTIGNTALKFRYLTLLRRWKTYAERWDKVLRDIENGTYEPHLKRAKRREEALRKQSATGLRSTGAASLDENAAAEPPPATTATPPPSAVPGMTDGDLRALHQRYLEALRAVGDGRDVKYESLLASLKKQVPELLRKNQCDLVSFNVAVKDGKVVLRATPKRIVRSDDGDKPAT